MGKLLLDSDDSDNDRGSAAIPKAGFKVNEEYAKRFEHNKKREELARCKYAQTVAGKSALTTISVEEKHGKTTKKRKRGDEDGAQSGPSEDESSSESEDEDEAGELATEALDTELFATLNAIRSKDPRIYDEMSTFYTTLNEASAPNPVAKKEKPLYLRDYHRENLLNGINGVNGEDKDEPMTYNQEQDALKRSIVQEMHAAAAGSDDDEEEEVGSENEFLKAKARHRPAPAPAVVDVENAERDPETFLSNFMAARAWVPTNESNFQPFESDDEEEERRAEEYEQAYNFRYEDPEKSNEKLRSHARDLAAKYSVRREEMNPRQKKREEDKARKEAAKQELREEKARLRKLRIEEVEGKVRRIKRAAGLKSKDIKPEDWAQFVDEDWDDAQWEEEMQKRFGDEYYADEDIESEGEGVPTEEKKRKAKKPKFDDDIDIKDIIPDFEDEEKAEFSLTDEEMADGDGIEKQTKGRKDHKKEKEEKRRESKKERRIIEQLVDEQLKLDLPQNVSNASGFRYRETSPKTFGLSSRDILLADDSQLNQFVGLKKLAAFREPEKKRKDQKNLGKKARLRQWRKDTFGDERGVQASELMPAEDKQEDADEEGGVDIRTKGKKKRRRSKKAKLPDVAAS